MNAFWMMAFLSSVAVHRVHGQTANIVEIIIPTNAPAASTTCTTATWLAWSDWSTCSEECGSCGVQLRTRTCLTTDSTCTCSGSSTGIQYCNLDICRYPKTTCCNNFKVTSYLGRFACLNQTALTTTA
ncbi:unnamed protein product [Caenorhabditis sp. 36 PRJEB53466]|nr:unnamed protein product [Caenorhabditis sp. 36 PRJEB53466]